MVLFHVRIAKPRDDGQVLALFKTHQRWHELVSPGWKKWLEGNEGKLFVAVVKGQIVGTSYLRFLRDGICWLEGHVVHPRFRRMGIGSALNRRARYYARGVGFKKVRLAVDARNRAALSKVRKHKFKSFLIFSEFRGHPSGVDDSEARLAWERDFPLVWNFIRNSEVFRTSKGLYAHSWIWQRLDERVVDDFVKGGRALLHEEKGKVSGVCLYKAQREYGGLKVDLCYLDGSAKSVRSMIGLLRKLMGKRNIRSLCAYIPQKAALHQAISSVGLTFRTHVWLFEFCLDDRIV